MNILELQKQHEIYNIFIELAKIPSPSLKEDMVQNKIIEFLNHPKINVKVDNFGNVIAKIQPTNTAKKSLLLSAHMDVVGDDSDVNILISDDEKYIETDKKRTLGADDKVGVAMAIALAQKIANNENLDHGGLELVFTRDEEQNMSGIKNLDTTQLNSEHILVLDADKLGDILVSGAGYLNSILSVKTFYGGHSGIDIHEEKRLNAVNLIAQLISQIPQGVIVKDETGTITSINVGAIIGGGIDSSIPRLLEQKNEIKNFSEFIIKNSMTNIINTNAYAIFSIRSASKPEEQKLLSKISSIINEFNQKYQNLAEATFETSIHLLPFERSKDNCIEQIATQSAKNCGIKYNVGSFHAGAETHIYANLKNMSNKTFKPYLIGMADIFNMHSPDEKVDILSMKKGFEFLEEIFNMFNSI